MAIRGDNNEQGEEDELYEVTTDGDLLAEFHQLESTHSYGRLRLRRVLAHGPTEFFN